MYIYCILNKVNKKRYIGQTGSAPKQRFNKHKANLNSNTHHNQHLQRAWNKYGKNSFEFKILSEVSSHEDLVKTENKYINKYKTLDSEYGYNMQRGGDLYITDEMRKKMSNGGKKSKMPPAQIKKCAQNSRIYKYPPVMDPSGVKHKISNLHAFCRTHSLDRSRILRVMRGISSSHHGWTLYTPSKKKADNK